jgi:hypothetical protein
VSRANLRLASNRFRDTRRPSAPALPIRPAGPSARPGGSSDTKLHQLQMEVEGRGRETTLKVKQALSNRGGPDQSRGSLRSGPSPHFPVLFMGPKTNRSHMTSVTAMRVAASNVRRRAPRHVREADAFRDHAGARLRQRRDRIRSFASAFRNAPFVRPPPRRYDAGPPRYHGVQQHERAPLVHAVRAGRLAASAFLKTLSQPLVM